MQASTGHRGHRDTRWSWIASHGGSFDITFASTCGAGNLGLLVVKFTMHSRASLHSVCL